MKRQYRERPAFLQLQLPRNAQLVTPQRSAAVLLFGLALAMNVPFWLESEPGET